MKSRTIFKPLSCVIMVLLCAQYDKVTTRGKWKENISHSHRLTALRDQEDGLCNFGKINHVEKRASASMNHILPKTKLFWPHESKCNFNIINPKRPTLPNSEK